MQTTFDANYQQLQEDFLEMQSRSNLQLVRPSTSNKQMAILDFILTILLCSCKIHIYYDSSYCFKHILYIIHSNNNNNNNNNKFLIGRFEITS
jgi:hypothetical protein